MYKKLVVMVGTYNLVSTSRMTRLEDSVGSFEGSMKQEAQTVCKQKQLSETAGTEVPQDAVVLIQ